MGRKLFGQRRHLSLDTCNRLTPGFAPSTDFPLQVCHTRFQDLRALFHVVFYVFNAVFHRRELARDLIFDLTEDSQDFRPSVIVPAVLLATANSSFAGKRTRHILFRRGFTIFALYGSVLAVRAGLALVTFGLELPTAIAGLGTGQSAQNLEGALAHWLLGRREGS